MSRPIRPWFRMYVEIFSDRKILRLRPDQRWLWTAILGAARESPTPGRLEVAEGVAMTSTELARYADVNVRMVRPALELMESLGMVTFDGDVVCVPNFLVRQYESDNVTARTRAFREREKQLLERSEERSQTVDGNVPKNVPGNVPETETETETEKSRPRKRGTRLPEGWLPNPEVRTQMAQEYPTVDLRLAHEKFKDYWTDQPGQKGIKLDWNGTWRNWIRGEAERTPNGGKPHTNGNTAPAGPPPELLGDFEALNDWYDKQAGRRAS